MVDGEAAVSLTEVAESRWRGAGCTTETSADVTGERWPASVPVQSRGMTVGIARTEIATASEAGVNEVARLFEASINAADRFIYIENQFTSAIDIARLLAQRMLDVPQLRVLIVTPKMHSSWFESQAMQSGRGGFIEQFVAADVMDRIRFLYPSTRDADGAAAVMVHSKVMIVDDRFLRVGSANLNNRSMGADTECDLAFEATSEAHRKYIARFRRQMIGHFCGVDEREIESNEADLFGFLDRLPTAAAGNRCSRLIRPATVGGMAGRRCSPSPTPRTPSPRPRCQSHVDGKNHSGLYPDLPRRSPASRWPGSTRRCAISPMSASSPRSFRILPVASSRRCSRLPLSSSAGWWCFPCWY
jgi:phosphatidylserine/phosphatidylglycerophosphate/cardiolipin synthase-like enzyme